MSEIVGIRPNLKAYCCSYTCTGMNDHEVRPKDYRLVGVSIYAMFCPHCGYALLWSQDVKNERKRTLNMIPDSKNQSTRFANGGR